MQYQWALILLIIGVFEIIFFFDLKQILLKNLIIYKKYYKLFKFNQVSDSWKEKVIKNYSLKLFISSFKIILVIIIIIIYIYLLNILFTDFYIYLINFKSFVLLTIYSLLYYNFKKFINGKLLKNSKNTS
jgi:hypothetical protein